jgi:hypothetical protein
VILSAMIQFPACGLLWTVDLPRLSTFWLSEDRPPPDEMKLHLVAAIDGNGTPVHPRWISLLWAPGSNTLALIREAAAMATIHAVRRLINGADGDVAATPELAPDVHAALEQWLPMNGSAPI